MRYFIISGASRGLGAALVKVLAKPENTIFCISRTRDDALIREAQEKGGVIEWLLYDLNNILQIDTLMNMIFQKINKQDAEGIYLINNAGVIQPLGPVEKASSPDIQKSVQVNIAAPMVLGARFIDLCRDFGRRKMILNITATVREPRADWACYFSAKAAIDYFTKCVGKEKMKDKNAVKIISIAPSIMNTDMRNEVLKRRGLGERLLYFLRIKRDLEKPIPPELVAKKMEYLMLHLDPENGEKVYISEINGED
ncbi:MAG: SDR family NAD(P)-dependent oxidoreductase [Brevinematales bacterium]|nr:SDR family NAD(P)-dependent oxidoreductase [Brevinematales bacterium]